MPAIDDAGAEVVAIGLGTPEAAREFAELTSFPLANLYADTTGAAYEALDFSKGFEPPVPVKVCPQFKHSEWAADLVFGQACTGSCCLQRSQHAFRASCTRPWWEVCVMNARKCFKPVGRLGDLLEQDVTTAQSCT